MTSNKLFWTFVIAIVIITPVNLYGIQQNKSDFEIEKSKFIDENLPVTMGYEVVDQKQEKYTGYLSVFRGILKAQSFKPTSSVISSIDVFVGREGNPGSDLVLSIRNDIYGSDLTTLPIKPGGVSLDISWHRFDIDDLNVIPGNTYYIILKSEMGDTSNSYMWGYGYYNIYKNGSLWYSSNNGDDWWKFDRYDFCFRTYTYSTGPPDNIAPDKPSQPSPENNSIDISVPIILSVLVTDSDYDRLDVYFYNKSDNSLIGKAENVLSGERASVIWNDLRLNKTYSWYTLVDDSKIVTESDYWNFTTREEYPPPYVYVEKKVWNGIEWSDYILTNLEDTIRFKITIYHTGPGPYVLYDIDVNDTIPSYLKYKGNSIVNGTDREPDIIHENYINWFFPSTEIHIPPEEYLEIEFNAQIIECGHSYNQVEVISGYCNPDIEYVTDYDAVEVQVDCICTPKINVDKKIWNYTNWVDHYKVKNYPAKIRFNITIQNNGTCELYDLIVEDIFDNGLVCPVNYSIEPNIITNGYLLWKLNDRLSPGENISIEYNATALSNTSNNVIVFGNSIDEDIQVTASDIVTVGEITGINFPPIIKNPSPAPNETNIYLGNDLNASLSVYVLDPNNDEVNVSFYNASDDNLIEKRKNVPSDSTISVYWYSLNYLTNYSWYVKVEDKKIVVTSKIWNFTTGRSPVNRPPEHPVDVYPANRSTNHPLTVELKLRVFDSDNDMLNVTFYNATDNSTLIEVENIKSGDYATYKWGGLTYNTKYSWYVRIDDSYNITNSSIWWFRTWKENTPPKVSNVWPVPSSKIRTVEPELEVFVQDNDNDLMKVIFYNALDDKEIGTVYNVYNNSKVKLKWDNLDYNNAYDWYVEVDDSRHITKSPTWKFTTHSIDLSINVKGIIGVNAEIKNICEGDVSDVEWNIKIESLFRDKLNQESNDVIDLIKEGQNITVKKMVYGLGFIDITFSVKSRDYQLNETMRCFLLGNFVFKLR